MYKYITPTGDFNNCARYELQIQQGAGLVNYFALLLEVRTVSTVALLARATIASSSSYYSYSTSTCHLARELLERVARPKLRYYDSELPLASY
jgi:hypothetical protein